MNTSELLIQIQTHARKMAEKMAKGPNEETLQMSHEISRMAWEMARQHAVEMAAPRFEEMGE